MNNWWGQNCNLILQFNCSSALTHALATSLCNEWMLSNKIFLILSQIIFPRFPLPLILTINHPGYQTDPYSLISHYKLTFSSWFEFRSICLNPKSQNFQFKALSNYWKTLQYEKKKKNITTIFSYLSILVKHLPRATLKNSLSN